MALVVGTNSYISLADANTHFTDALYATEWDDANSTDREAALRLGTTTLEAYDYYGTRTDTTTPQALKFPRTNIPAIDGVIYASDEIPNPIALACAEMALVHLKRNITTTTAQQKYKSVKLSSTQAEYRDGMINMETTFVNAQLKGFVMNSGGQPRAIHG